VQEGSPGGQKGLAVLEMAVKTDTLFRHTGTSHNTLYNSKEGQTKTITIVKAAYHKIKLKAY